MNISKNMNKVLLTIIACVAVNQTFTSHTTVKDKLAIMKEAAAKKIEALKIEWNELKYEEFIKKINDNRTLREAKVKERSDLIKKFDDDKISEEARNDSSSYNELETEIVFLDESLTALEKAKGEAWAKVHPYLTSVSKTFSAVVLGGLIINKFGLTGGSATLVKYVSAGTISAVAIFAAVKAYNYLFEDEIEDEDDIF